MAKTSTYAVADIGGTNARFAIFDINPKSRETYSLSKVWSQTCDKFDSVEAVAEAFFNTHSDVKVNGLCISIAGPVNEGEGVMTNLGWEFSAKALKKKFRLPQVEILNDFSGLAYSLPELRGDDLFQIKTGEAKAWGPLTVIGPGTGFGTATLVRTRTEWQVLESEGGHITFAPVTALETEILRVLRKQYERVTVEHLLSGSGLVRIYQSLAEINGQTAEKLLPGDIVETGLENSQSLSAQVMEVFCEVLGSVAGDIALINNCSGGMYLAGGILPRFQQYLHRSNFVERFLEKAPMKEVVEPIPVHLITSASAALIGAGFCIA
ncbi:MAG: glucokinase [Agarilytica sp.]